jgi:hypothetical protein
MKLKIKKLFGYIWKKKIDFIILSIFSLALYSIFDLESAILWTIFLVFARFDWDSRYVGGMAIFWLLLCPFFLYLQLDAAAEQSAVYAYFLLVITVVLQIIEYFKYPDRFPN